MSYFRICGLSAPSGRSPSMALTFSRTSDAATFWSRPSSNSSRTWQKLFAHVAVMCLSPSTCTTASSMGLTTDVSISSGEAPGYVTVTVT